MLQWLRENGCPWDEETCALAAEGGHLEVLQWMRANGCPWNWRTVEYARRYRHFELSNWAIANGCPRMIREHARRLGECGKTDNAER